MHCSIMFLRVNICLQHDLPFLKPACCSLRHPSIASFSLSKSTILKTLPGINSNVILCQLLQSARSPFLAVSKLSPYSQLPAPQHLSVGLIPCLFCIFSLPLYLQDGIVLLDCPFLYLYLPVTRLDTFPFDY